MYVFYAPQAYTYPDTTLNDPRAAGSCSVQEDLLLLGTRAGSLTDGGWRLIIARQLKNSLVCSKGAFSSPRCSYIEMRYLKNNYVKGR